MVGIKDVLNPDDIAIYRAVAGGVTTANILHGSANSIGGKCTVIKMRWGKDAHDMIFEGAMPGIKFALGENPKRAGNPTGQRIGAGNVRALSSHSHGRGGRDSRGIQRGQGVPTIVERLRPEGRARASRPSRRAAI